MVRLQNHAIKILNNCRGILDEIDGVAARVLRPGENAAVLSTIVEVQKRLDSVASGRDIDLADALHAALETLEEIVNLPEYRRLSRHEIYGVTVEARTYDVLNGLKILAEYLAQQQRVASGDTSNRSSLGEIARSSEFQLDAERIVKTLAQGAFIFHEGSRDDTLEARLRGLDYQLDRVSELAEQLLLAGPDTRSGGALQLFEALQNVQTDFREFLVSSPNKRVGNLVIKASELSKRLVLDYGNAFDDEEAVTAPPQQVLAPFQFRIAGEKLTLQPQEANPKASSSAIAAAALRTLTVIAEDIAEDLARSNHPRLFRAFARLQNALESNASIVEVGMLCASFEGQVGAAAEELSDSLVALLSSFTKGVTNYASQFEEWQDFSDNAAEANFTSQDAETYAQVARVLATELERRQEVDDRVPEALRQVADWNDRVSTPRSRLSVGRTVLNIIAVCYTELVKKPAKVVVSGVGVATGVGALAVVLNYALPYASEMAKTPEGAWLRPAVRVIENQLGKLENG